MSGQLTADHCEESPVHDRLPAERRTEMAALVAACLGAGWVLAHVLGLLGALDPLTFVVLGIGALVAVLVGIRRWRPQPRWPWLVDVAALLLFLVGGALREMYGTLGDLSAERSLVPEPFSLAGYVACGAVLIGVARARLGPRWRDIDAGLDAVIAGLAALALAWLFLIVPALAQADVSVGVRIALACYPALSVFIVTMGTRLAFTPGRRPGLAFKLLLVALIATLVGDVLYMLAETRTVPVDLPLLDLPYALAYVAVIVAVLHPSMREVTAPLPRFDGSPRRGLAVVAVALCVPGLVLLLEPEMNLTDRLVLGAIVLLLTAAAAWRIFRALRAHARAEAALAHLANHDELTGLPNRIQLAEHLQRLHVSGGSDQPQLALLYLDLDRFKLINDTLGHQLGDELLQAVAQRLRQNVRPDDLVARVGGDEFVIVLPRVSGIEEAHQIAERTRLCFQTPFRVGTAEIAISTSIGMTLAQPGDLHSSAQTMLRDADTAMYAAKEPSGDAVAVFDGEMRKRVTTRHALERELRGALDRRELDLHLQPVVQLHDGRITGFEALLRWNHPVRGVVAPGHFVPVAEETGMIVPIGDWVIDEATRTLAELRDTVPHGADLTVSVNVSVRQLRDARICDQVARAILANDLPRGALTLEITESLLAENLVAIGQTLTTLRRCGVRVAIDDFGTGYSSLTYLRDLPVDIIKIDQHFVRNLGEGRADDSMVAAVVAIAESLGFDVVAEGVETREHAERLVELGCSAGQGYHFSRPVGSAAVRDVIDRLGVAAAPRLRVLSDEADPAETG